MPGSDWYVAELYSARVRFGLWDEILTLPAPSDKLPGLMIGYLFSRTIAHMKQYRTASSPPFTIGQKPPGKCVRKWATAISPQRINATGFVKRPRIIMRPPKC